MKCSVFIATSADGYIATDNGGIDWLHSAGNPEAEMGDDADMGFAEYIASVDCMVMGRKCMEKLSSFNLSDERWPYRGIRIVVLSDSVKEPPENLRGRVEMYSGEITELMSSLEEEGFNHAYIDGGTTITSFLNLALIDEMSLTLAPVLLGGGLTLFGKMEKQVTLEHGQARAYPNGFIQLKYKVANR